MEHDQSSRGAVSATCPACGGQRIDIEMAAGAGVLGLVPFHRRRNFGWRPNVVTGVSGVACLECGLLQLYASHLDRLRREYRPPAGSA